LISTILFTIEVARALGLGGIVNWRCDAPRIPVMCEAYARRWTGDTTLISMIVAWVLADDIARFDLRMHGL